MKILYIDSFSIPDILTKENCLQIDLYFAGLAQNTNICCHKYITIYLTCHIQIIRIIRNIWNKHTSNPKIYSYNFSKNILLIWVKYNYVCVYKLKLLKNYEN